MEKDKKKKVSYILDIALTIFIIALVKTIFECMSHS